MGRQQRALRGALLDSERPLFENGTVGHELSLATG